MHILIRVNKTGDAQAVYPVPSDSHPIFLSASAYQELTRRLTAANGRCQECGIFARSGELLDGKCSPAVGCGIDSILNPIRLTNEPQQKHLAMTTHIGKFIKLYVRKVFPEIGPGSPEEQGPQAPASPPSNDPLSGW